MNLRSLLCQLASAPEILPAHMYFTDWVVGTEPFLVSCTLHLVAENGPPAPNNSGHQPAYTMVTGLLPTQLNAGSNIRSYHPTSMSVGPYLHSHCTFSIPSLTPLVWKFILSFVLPISFSYSRSINIHVPYSPRKPPLQMLCPKACPTNISSRQPTNGLRLPLIRLTRNVLSFVCAERLQICT